MRALSNNPRERFQSASEMAEVLKQILETLAPGYEENAQRQMSQFMRSIFDSTWLSERHQLMRALQSVQKMASKEEFLEREQTSEGEAEDDDDDEHTIAMIPDEEMQEFDESDPFTSPGTGPISYDAPRPKSRRGMGTSSQKRLPSSGGGLSSIQKGLRQLKELLGVIGIAIFVSAAVALLILLLRSLG